MLCALYEEKASLNAKVHATTRNAERRRGGLDEEGGKANICGGWCTIHTISCVTFEVVLKRILFCVR